MQTALQVQCWPHFRRWDGSVVTADIRNYCHDHSTRNRPVWYYCASWGEHYANSEFVPARSLDFGETFVKLLLCGLAFVLVPQLAFANEKPDWAFPVTEKDLPKPRIEGTQMRSVPGSPVAISRAAADDFFNAPDWRPELHPPMPKVVQYGNKDTQVRACGSCHLPTGNGHDESAYVAG